MVEITTTAVQDTVRWHREKLRMTIPELASKAGVSPLVIYNIENTRARYHSSITTDVAEWIAYALVVSVHDIEWPCPLSDVDDTNRE